MIGQMLLIIIILFNIFHILTYKYKINGNLIEWQ